MNYLSIAVIGLNIGLIGLALAYFRGMLVTRRRASDPQRSLEADADRSASLFKIVRETLAAHVSKLVDLQSLPGIALSGGDQADVDQWRRSNLATAESLDANGKKLSALLESYGDLYKSERSRIDDYAQQARQLDSQLANVEQDADGSNKVLLSLVREILQENNKLRTKVTNCQEQVSELIVQSVKSSREARTDSLTQLPNRRAWDERLDAINLDGQTSLALIDVDDFKLINDQFGHAAGDGMISLIGTILRNSPSASAYRVGGDEFALLINPPRGQADDHVAESIRGRIAEASLRFKGDKISASVSIGVALGLPGEPIQSLLVRADNALYAAKEAGGNQVQANRNSAPADSADIHRLELVQA